MDYYKLEYKISELNHFAEFGLTDLKSTGIASVDKWIKLKKGYPIFIAGNPGHGKTEFCFELLINLSILYKWKHFIYSGEGGNVEHIYHELIRKYSEKNYHYMTESDKIKAEFFISTHFVIANCDKDYTINDFYDTVLKTENELGITFDTTTFDPFNDIKEELDKFGNREDKYLAYALKQCRISSKKNNRIDILINHVSDVPPQIDKETGLSFLPCALPTQWAGGRTWWRRAFTMIVIYRPYTFRKDINGKNFEKNETHVVIQKTKPKGIGENGTASIFFDGHRNRYYSYDETGQLLYSCETNENAIKQPKLQPSEDWTQSKRESIEPDMPF